MAHLDRGIKREEGEKPLVPLYCLSGVLQLHIDFPKTWAVWTSLRSGGKCEWEREHEHRFPFAPSLRWSPVGVNLSLGHQGRRLFDLPPRLPHGQTSAGARFLSSDKHYHISRWYEGQTPPRRRLCPGRVLPAYTAAAIGSFTRLGDRLDVSQTQCSANAALILKELRSCLLSAKLCCYIVQRRQKYSRWKWNCGYLCKNNDSDDKDNQKSKKGLVWKCTKQNKYYIINVVLSWRKE